MGVLITDRIDGIRLTRLDSGLIVATDTMAGIETAAIGVWVGVGTRHEPAAINGVAHLLEHMAFKGTQRRNARDISVEIESVGGHLNAYTSRENTALPRSTSSLVFFRPSLAKSVRFELLRSAKRKLDWRPPPFPTWG